MNLTTTCPAIGHWLRDTDAFDVSAFDDDSGIVTIDERYRLHLRVHRNHLLIQCRIVTLPNDGARDVALKQLLTGAAARFEDEPFGLAIDPAGEAAWLQALEPLSIPFAHFIDTLDDFLNAVESLRALTSRRQSRGAVRHGIPA